MASMVQEYFQGLSGWRREVCEQLHRLVLESEPDLRSDIKWSRPVYELNSLVCYLEAHSDHVNFGFWRGVELDDPGALLEGTGKSMRHVKFERDEGIPHQRLQELLLQAIELDQVDAT